MGGLRPLIFICFQTKRKGGFYFMPIIVSILLLVIGMVLLIKGADFFVEGASNIAKALHIPTLVIGLTLVSIGTSAPEFAVSLTASLKGANDLSFGNIVGSNIFNTFIVIGVSAIITPLVVSKNMQKYDLPILAGIYLLLTLFSFVISAGAIQRWEAIILFSLTIIYTIFLILREKKTTQEEEKIEEKKKPWWLNLIYVIIGLAGIIIGGDFVVDGAKDVALKLGMSEMLIGLTIVAVGTSLPELVTSIVAAKKGENDIAVGNAIGSCIFNVVLILGFCSILSPANVDTRPLYALFDVLIMISTVVIIFIFSLKKREINKLHGIVMIVIYVTYLTVIILRDTGVFL